MKEEREKKILLVKIGVGFLMIFVFILWFLNLKNAWHNQPAMMNSQTPDLQTELKQIKEDLNKTILELGAQINSMKAEEPNLNNATSSGLIEDLIKETKRLASSSASSTVFSSTPKNNNCPEYINCMPTIGEAKPCQIPVGCEGITQIAY